MPGPQGFPRRERLTRKREYELVFRNGRKRVGPAFICYVARQEGEGRKFGLAVSRKVGSAVVRNRVKRFLREFYRTHRAQLAHDVHIVVVARPQAAELSFHQCTEAMRRLLKPGESSGNE
ncbi:MAG: ribonuclease P protein component [Candidatus Hydrogenedentes bacterium]|nr:ribonuclease P protein component [Candidatus Hydrogenedentota bacterium]